MRYFPRQLSRLVFFYSIRSNNHNDILAYAIDFARLHTCCSADVDASTATPPLARPAICLLDLRSPLSARARVTDQAELTALQELIKPGMVIADIRADVGFYTIKMVSSVGHSGRLLAFDPDAFSFGLLQSLINREGVNNVEPFQLALGDKTGRAVLYCSKYNRA